MSEIDDYLLDLEPSARAALERVRDAGKAQVPAAEEGRSYGIPALKYRGRPLLGFVAAKTHLSIFPFSPAVIEAAGDRLAGFELSKGTIRFSVENQLPDDVLAEIVSLRAAEIDGARH